METRAGYIAVGSFVIVIAAAAFGFVLWMARLEGAESPVKYLVYFEGSVTGLQEGGTVRYRGVPVGSVTDIRIDPKNIERIRVTVALSPDTPVKTDTVATMALQGITGLAYIQLIAGTQESPALRPAPGQEYAVIQSRTTGLQRVMQDIPQIAERIVNVTDRLSKVLSDDNLQAISQTLRNVQKLSATIATRSGDIDRIVSDTRVAIGAFREASVRVSKLTADLSTKIGPIADNADKTFAQTKLMTEDARKAAESFKKVADQLNSLIAENRGPITDFSSNGLYEFSQFISEARVLVDSLNRLTTQIERDPARFFFGDTQKGFEAK